MSDVLPPGGLAILMQNFLGDPADWMVRSTLDYALGLLQCRTLVAEISTSRLFCLTGYGDSHLSVKLLLPPGCCETFIPSGLTLLSVMPNISFVKND